MMLNHRLRNLGLRPQPVGTQPWRDLGKSLVYRSVSKARRVLKRT
jgi:hypothetical protein